MRSELPTERGFIESAPAGVPYRGGMILYALVPGAENMPPLRGLELRGRAFYKHVTPTEFVLSAALRLCDSNRVFAGRVHGRRIPSCASAATTAAAAEQLA